MAHEATRSRLICRGWPAEASLNVKSPGSTTRPPEGPPQAVCRDDTQTSAQLGKPNSGGSYRTHIPAGHSGCPLWTLVVLTPAAAGASSSQDPFRAWVEGVPDVSTQKQNLKNCSRTSLMHHENIYIYIYVYIHIYIYIYGRCGSVSNIC